MAPKKQNTIARRRSSRLEQKEQEKKRTNLKDLLNKSQSQKSKTASGTETDGDFIFKRTASQLEQATTSKSNKLPKSSKSNHAARSKNTKGVRKLTKKDIMATPEISRVDDTYEEHSTSIQVALPISDTPIIRRNKQIRNGNSGKGVRRSSLGNRGKRVSSIGNGFQAIPHEKVPTSEFYKHLDSDLPDPHKMRQLLSWCSQRIFEKDKDRHIKNKNKLASEELTALNIAKVIKEEFVRDLINGKIGISWWNNNEDDSNDNGEDQEPKVLLPNEKNVKNLKVLHDLTKRLNDLKETIKKWETNLSQQIQLPNDALSIDKSKNNLPLNDELIKRYLDDSIVEEISQIESSTQLEISNNLETSIDIFNDIVHKLKSSSSIRKKYIELRSLKLSEILDSTFNDDSLLKIQQSDVNKDIDTDQLLRGISRLE